MSPEIYLIADDLPGALFIMPCPCGDHLRRDIAAYRARGIGTLVSMLAQGEAVELGLSDENVNCAVVGIRFVSSPVADFGLPEMDAFAVLVRRIAALLRRGEDVAVHCRAGIGRSGMVTAGVLIALGHSAATAVEMVSKGRGVSIPDTVEQGKFIAEFAQSLVGRVR